MRKILFLLLAMVPAIAAWSSKDDTDTAALVCGESDYVSPFAEKAALAHELRHMLVSSRLNEIMDEHGIKCAVVSSASVVALTAYRNAMRRRTPRPRTLARHIGDAMKSQEVRLKRPKIFCNAYI